MLRTLCCFAIALISTAVQAQATKLSPASRTVYKCDVNGKVTYSDNPCLTAERLEIEPTRGADSITGSRRRGKDVQREMHREQVAEAVKPLTGMNAEQLEQAGKRRRLDLKSQTECARLDSSIPALERREAAELAAADRASVQQTLLAQRQRSRQLGC
jgi:hypothetical protein